MKNIFLAYVLCFVLGIITGLFLIKWGMIPVYYDNIFQLYKIEKTKQECEYCFKSGGRKIVIGDYCNTRNYPITDTTYYYITHINPDTVKVYFKIKK